MRSFLILLTALLVACSPSSPTGEGWKPAPVSTIDEPTVVSAKLNTDLSQYSIPYYTPVTRESLASASPILADDGTEFRLVEHSPDGEVPAGSKRPSVVLTFSQPVIPLSRVGLEASADQAVSVSPELPGRWRWLGTRVIVLEPSADLADQVEYTVSVKDGLKSLQGKVLQGESRFTFHGQPLSISRLGVGPDASEEDLEDVPPSWAQRISVDFNTDVDPGVLGKFLQVSVNDKKVASSVWPGSSPRQIVLSLSAAPASDTTVQVTILPGARARSGSLVTEESSARTFHTLLPFRNLSDALDSDWSVVFSHPVDPTSVAKALRLVPDVGLKPANIVVTNRTIKLTGLDVNPDTDYTLIVDPSLKDIWGRSLGQRLRLEWSVGQLAKFAVFPGYDAQMLEKGSPPRLAWASENVREGDLLVQKTTEPYAKPEGSYEPIDFSEVRPNTRHVQAVDFGNLLDSSGTGWVSIGWSLFSSSDANRRENTWMSVQVTDLGLTMRYGANRIVAWVTSLSTGKPVPGAKVTLQSWQGRGMTSRNQSSATADAQGLAVFKLSKGEYLSKFSVPHETWREETLRVLVEAGNDKIVMVPNWSHDPWSQGVSVGEGPLTAEQGLARTFLFSDRGLYRPGETVTWRALDKTWDGTTYQNYTGSWRVVLQNWEDEEDVVELTGEASPSGGSWGRLVLPADLPPGDFSLIYQRQDEHTDSGWSNTTSEPVTVANFRPLLFTVVASHPEVPALLGDTLSARLQADYLSGGTVNQGSVQVWWSREPWNFTGAGGPFAGWAFGPSAYDSRTTLTEDDVSLGRGGALEVRQRAVADGIAGMPYLYRAHFDVTDAASHQSASAETRQVVHPAAFYLGVRMGGQNPESDGGWLSFVPQGQDARLDMTLVKPDGTPWTTGPVPVTVEFVLHEWKEAQQQATGGSFETRWVETKTSVATLPVSIQGGTAGLSWRPTRAGEYSVEIRARDASGRTVVTSRDFYVSGAEWVNWTNGGSTQLGLTPEHQVYLPGQTARLIVRSPLSKGRYLVTVEREGILDQRVVELSSSSSTVEVPIQESYLPVVYVSIASFTQRTGKLTHDYDQSDLDKPHVLYGVAALNVDSSVRRIDVSLANDQALYRPGTPAQVTITATNRGKPVVDAEVTFLAVDRAVVDLIGYHVPDPLEYFYRRDFFPLQVRGSDSRSLLLDPVTYVLKDQPGGSGDDGKLATRSDFRATAAFEPSVKTDRNGQAKVTFTLPDSLTSYRTTAFAAKGELYGLGEGVLNVRNPITVKANLPRLLRERDTAFAGVLVTNLDKKSHDVTIEISSNLVTIDKEAKKVVNIPVGQSVEVAFQLAAVKAGSGTVTFTVHSDVLNEKVEQPFTVVRPDTWETVATLGKVSSGKGPVDFTEEALRLPAASPDGKAQLQVTVDATRIASLGNAFQYLFAYPYGCLEQRSSKLLPLVLFGKYLPGFAAGWGLPQWDPQSVLNVQLPVFAGSQLENGGFPLWPNGSREVPYVTLRVAHILLLAQKAGLNVGTSIDLPQLLARVASLTTTVKDDHLEAYGLYLLALGGQNVSSRLDAAFRRWYGASSTPTSIAAMTLGGLAYAASGNSGAAAKVLERLKAWVKPDARSVDIDAHRVRTEWDDPDAFYGSTLETYALLLMLYHQVNPTSDMNQRLLTALNERQKAGVWGSTAETYWALQAYAQVLSTEEAQPPAFDATVTLADATLLQHRFEGLRADQQSITSDLTRAGAADQVVPLRLEKKGPGTLFYAATLRYNLPPELTGPVDRGLEVFTEVLDWDAKPVTDGLLTPGKLYRMRATLATGKSRIQVGLRVPVPSGAEILDARLTSTSRDADNGDARIFVQDNEVQFVFPVLDAGSRSVEFLFRAVTQGVYPTPGAQAEAMYQPEVFGRDLGRLLIIRNP